MGKLKRAFREGIEATKKEWSILQKPLIPSKSPLKYVKSGFGPGKLGRFIYGLGSLITFSIFYASLREGYLPLLAVIVIVMLLGLLTFITGHTAKNIYKRLNQRKRDKRSAFILSQVKHGNVGHYSLYLRSFDTTDRMRQKDDRMTLGDPTGAFDPRSQAETDLETVIAEAVEDEIPLIALGRPGEHVGAGRVAIDEEHWQQNIHILANKAILLFVLPFASPGTQWEIEWILTNDRLSHSIFIMPPKSGKKGSIDWEKIWHQLKPMMGEMKLALPTYIERGMFFMFTERGEVSKVVGFPVLLEARWLGRQLKELLSEISF